MPVTLSIQAIIDAQTTALNTTINAARDNVKADNTTQITNQNTSLTAAINAARDNVKADNVTQVSNQSTALTAAINGNTDTKTAAVTTAVNAKGVIKSKQKIAWGNATSTVTIAAVDTSKTIVVLDSYRQQGGTGTRAEATITNSTTVSVYASDYGTAQIVEFF